MNTRHIAAIAANDQMAAEFWTCLRDQFRRDPDAVLALANIAMDHFVQLARKSDQNRCGELALASRLGLIGIYSLHEHVADWESECAE